MFIQPDALPGVLTQIPGNEESPTPTIGQDEALNRQNEATVASTDSVSNWRQVKGG